MAVDEMIVDELKWHHFGSKGSENNETNSQGLHFLIRYYIDILEKSF
jgi:hypothetical protein